MAALKIVEQNEPNKVLKPKVAVSHVPFQSKVYPRREREGAIRIASG
jgi:hypothetical protein